MAGTLQRLVRSGPPELELQPATWHGALAEQGPFLAQQLGHTTVASPSHAQAHPGRERRMDARGELCLFYAEVTRAGVRSLPRRVRPRAGGS
ncbi:MAG: hypothetical protein ACRDF8_10515 [Chloroflexota bacterium]